jgi:phosphodiesterase/alkaline phosphatase D-like protein
VHVHAEVGPGSRWPGRLTDVTEQSTTSQPSRRTVLKGAALTAAAAAVANARLFDAAAAAKPAQKGIFGYGVASGDPTGNAVIIWTRATPPAKHGKVATPGSGLGKPLTVQWDVALDEDFTKIVRQGHVRTSAASDHTVKIDVTGLKPYTRYWYRFSAEGEASPVGRTQTAGDDRSRVHALRFALVSCSNYTGGYFTAYRAIGQRDDLDFVMHVGDYIYEYGNGADRYGPPALEGTRDAVPDKEIVELRDYRLRHALHKADPDAQLAHKNHPWITIFDDHELANNAWSDGAENHQPNEGDFYRRRKVAYQAYLEWMPIRLPDQNVPHQGTRFFRRFSFGPLGDLSILETRQNRSAQVDVPPFSTSGGGFIPVGVPAIDAQLADPDRHLPEPEQLNWLLDGVAHPTRWHLVGNQVILAPVRLPGALFNAPVSLLLNSDQWDGYQADQAAVITHLAAQPAKAGDVVVLTGDIHSSWAIDIPAGSGANYRSAGVEFVCPSVTSDGFYELAQGQVPAGTPTEAVLALTQQAAGAIQQVNPWVKYLDGIGHGFTLIDVTPERVQADFFHTPRPSSARPDPRVDPNAVPAYTSSWQTLAGSRRVSPATGPVTDRSDSPAG